MRLTVYIETSFISYLVARPSRNDRFASNQELTHKWWQTQRQNFDLYVSAVVLGEAARGDVNVAAGRVAIARELRLAQVTRQAVDLAAALVAGAGVPQKANEDALHIANAATNRLGYLLNWNWTHIAKAVTIPRVNAICRSHGFEPPLIYTPQEFMES